VSQDTLTALIEARLREALAPTELQVWDDSEAHKGHAGAARGGGHFELLITSDRFSGLRSIARHRLVYDALGDLMQSRIHALSINAKTPEESI
jgi:BolA family transcriptional regulator, general stress-responsive regulator